MSDPLSHPHTTGTVQVSSHDLPNHRHYRDWLQENLEGMRAIALRPGQQPSFSGRIVSLVTSTSELHDAQMDGFVAERSMQHIRSDQDSPKLALLYVRRGRIQVEYQDGTGAQAGTGNYLLFDSSQPSLLQCDQSNFIQLTLPNTARQDIPVHTVCSNHFAQTLSCSPLTQVLTLQMEQSHDLVHTLGSPWEGPYMQVLESMAMNVIRAVCRMPIQRDETHHKSLYDMALNFIRLNLSDPRLNAGQIAHALGCGRSTLYREFNLNNQGIAQYIREERLQTLADLLRHPLYQRYSVADLAYQCGLHDPSNVGRLFRAHFAMPPSAYRALHQNP